MEKADKIEAYPLVSVIIPLYNAEKYIDTAVNSVLNQSWPNIEIIIIDDGSSDSSYEKARQHERLNVKIVMQSNKGASAARNKGLALAGGEFIQFLDADDMLGPDKIRAQVNVLQNNPGYIAVCSTVQFNNGSEPDAFQPNPYDESFLSSIDKPVDFLIRLLGGYNFRGSMVQPAAWLTPRNIIDKAGEWNEELTLDDDGEFFARVMLASSGIIKTDGKIYYRKFVVGNNNLSSTQSIKALQSLYRSIKLKAGYMYSFGESTPAKKATYKQLKELQIISYLVYPALYNALTEELSAYPKWKYIPAMGGKLINGVASLLGWRLAKRLKLLYSKTRP